MRCIRFASASHSYLMFVLPFRATSFSHRFFLQCPERMVLGQGMLPFKLVLFALRLTKLTTSGQHSIGERHEAIDACWLRCQVREKRHLPV